MKNDHKLILLVEDEIIIAMSQQLLLKKNDYSVIIANTPEQALKEADRDDIDLILMDIDLGKGKPDGTELAKIILSKKEVPIVFCTSHSEKEMVEKVKDITKYGYVLKNSGEFVLKESISMAFELFDSHIKTKESEEKYRAAFITSPDSININRLDGLYVDINEGFTRITGYTEEDVIGKYSSEIEIWEKPEDRRTLIAGLQQDGFVENLESVFRCKDGTLKTAIMSARLIEFNNEPHILSITRDITERKKLEQSFIEMANSFPNSYISIIEKDLTIGLSAGQEFKRNKMNPKDFIGLSIEAVFGEKTHFVKKQYEKTFNGEECTFKLEINNQNQEYKTVPILNNDGTVDRILAFVRVLD